MKKTRLLWLALAMLGALQIHAQTLPYFEGFENVGSTTTFTTAQSSINGLSGWAYDKSGIGRLRFAAGSGFYQTGNHAATLDCSTNGATSTNDLILTLDLSSYAKSSLGIELSFYFMQHGDESHNNDRVWIRGSSTDSWIEVYDWYANRGGNGDWEFVDGIDIVQELNNAKQTLTKSFQLRIGQEDNFPATSTSASDGFTVDDISMSPIFPRNARISNVAAYCSGSSDLDVEIENYGTDTLKTAHIRWALNGQQQTPVYYRGVVPPGQTALVNLGNITFSNQIYRIGTLVDSVNGQVDDFLGDTATYNTFPAFNGQVTVGTNGDFSTFDAAVQALNNRGICGPTTVVLDAGTYTGPFTFGNIPGSGPNTPLVIDGQDSSTCILTHDGDNRYSTLELNGAQYITLRNLKIESTASTDGWGVHMWNECNYITIENCWVSLSTSGTSDLMGIVGSGSATSESSSGDNVDSLFIYHNRITGGEDAIHLEGSSGLSLHLRIVGNDINRPDDKGVEVDNWRDIIIDQNIVQNLRSNFGDALYLIDVEDFVVTSNELLSTDWSMYINDGNFNGTKRALIANNIVYSPTDEAMYLNDIRNTDVWHNTVIGEPGVHFDDYDGLDVRNNIFIGINDYAFECDQNTGFDFLDNNIYHVVNHNMFDYDNTDYSDLAAFKAAVPQFNEASFEKTPNFAGANNFRLSSSQPAESGANVGIMVDIDGQTRCQFAPTIGADESGYPKPITRAGYSLNDSLYINSSALFSNNYNPIDPVTHEWYINGQLVSTDVDLRYAFDSVGRYVVKLISLGCGGIDSTQGVYNVRIPTKAPTPDFVANSTIIDINESVRFANLSSGGADSFYWRVDSYFVTSSFGIPIKSHTYVNGTDTNSMEPEIEFNYAGNYRICLTAYNLKGETTVCKTAYINVRETANMCAVIDESSNYSGVLYDEGGANSNYSSNSTCSYLIDPCTEQITLNINQFDLDNGDLLRIYDGRDNSGTPLHNYHPDYQNGLTGTINSNFRTQFTATSGEMYFEFESDGSGVAEGFAITWQATTPTTSQNGSVAMTIPDTVCVGVPFAFSSQSTGLDVEEAWYMNNAGGPFFGPDYRGPNATHTYNNAGVYEVKLEARGCNVEDSLLKTVYAIRPTTAPVADFNVDVERPSVGDNVTLLNASNSPFGNCVESYEWHISPSNYQWVSGSSARDENPMVSFNDTGCYEVTLIAGNSAGSDTITQSCAIRVIPTCIPSVKNPEGNPSITRVAIASIDNISEASSVGYTSFVNAESTNLIQGATYSITIERASGNVNMNRAVWIDYNNDGTMSANERVVSSSADTNQRWTASFTIPTNVAVGGTRLRVGVNLANLPNAGCGPNQFGEFEDYRVFISPDNKAPEMFLIGAADTTINQCETWNDPGAFAIDNVNGRFNNLPAIGNVQSSTVGVYQLRYEATDSAGNLGTISRTVRVAADKQAPTLTLIGSATDTINVNDNYVNPGATAIDVCDGNITNSIVVNGNVNANQIGDYTITYSVSDQAGNSAMITRRVFVRDIEAPTILLGGNDTLYREVGRAFSIPDVQVQDNYDTNPTVEVLNNVDPFVLGTYTIRYRAVDASGNRTPDVVQYVIVRDTEAPQVLVSSPNDTLVLSVYDQFSFETPILNDNYSSTAYLQDQLQYSGTYLRNFGQGDATDLGIYTVITTTTDESGNIGSLTRYVEVIDDEAPSITFNGGNPKLIARWNSFILTDYTPADNFYLPGDVTVDISGEVDKNKAGTYTITYCLEDPSGNEACYERKVVVQETQQTVGIEEVETLQMQAYPNPASQVLHIEIAAPTAQSMQIELTNMQGQVLREAQLGKQQEAKVNWNVSDLPAGVYILRMPTNNGYVQKRISITR